MRTNFRVLLFVGKDDALEGQFGSRVYVVGARNRTVHIAHGAIDIKNKKVYPKYLQHMHTVYKSNEAARDAVLDNVKKHLARDYSLLKRAQKSTIAFRDGEFRFKKIDGSVSSSSPKKSSKKKASSLASL